MKGEGRNSFRKWILAIVPIGILAGACVYKAFTPTAMMENESIKADLALSVDPSGATAAA